MKKLIVANWKDKLSPGAAVEWLDRFIDGYVAAPEIEIILAVPFVCMAEVSRRCAGLEGVTTAAQDISPFPPGGYTGATPADWLADLAEYTLVGHLERRRYFHETDRDAADRVETAVAAGLTPILCMDENIVRNQLAALENDDLLRVITAYTPSDAVSLEIARKREGIAGQAGRFAGLSGGRPVLYGGGVNAENAASLLTIDSLNGVMTSAGCLDPGGFLRLLENARRALAGGYAGS